MVLNQKCVVNLGVFVPYLWKKGSTAFNKLVQNTYLHLCLQNEYDRITAYSTQGIP